MAQQLVNGVVEQVLTGLSALAWEWDLDRGRFACVSPLLPLLPRADSQKGIGAESLFDYLPSADKMPLVQAAEFAFKGNLTLERELKLQLGDELKSFRLIGNKLDRPRGRFLGGVLLAASDSQLLLDEILNNLPLLVYVKDLDGRYLFANQAYAEVCRVPLVRLLGRRHDEVFVNSPAESLARFEQSVIATGKAVQFEESLPFLTPERIYISSRFPIHNRQSLVCALGGTLQDVTELRQSQRSVESQRQRQNQLLDSVHSLIWSFDSEGRIQFMNRLALNLFKQPFSAFRNKTVMEMVPDWEPGPHLHAGLLEVASTGQPILDIVFRFDKDGREFWTKVDRIPIKDAKGNIESVLMVVNDISKLRKNEQKLARNYARNRALIANSFEAIFCIAFVPPIPLNSDAATRVELMLKHGYYMDCNTKFAAQRGLEVSQVVDHAFSDVAGEDEGSLKMIHEAALHDFVADNLVVSANEDGVQRWWEYSFKADVRDDCIAELWGTTRDITNAMQESMVLQHNESRYRSFIANSHEGIFHAELQTPVSLAEISEEAFETIATELIVTECNDEYARQYGYRSSAECVGQYLYDVESVAFVIKKIREFIRNGYQLERHIMRLPRNNEKETWLSISMEGVIVNGCLTGCWGTQRDITEREQYLQRLEYQANHDALTGLPNRQKLYTELHHRLEVTAPGRELALILIDLDHFKEINDTLGHHIGDLLLKELGPRLQAAVEGLDGLVARLGGDEFAVMLAGATEARAVQVAYDLLGVLSTSFNLQGFQAEVAASIGIAYSPRHSDDLAGLMRYADIAMYQAKTEGLGVVEYDPSLDTHTPRRLALMTDLGKAIREDQLCLYFQPKIDLGSRSVRGFEALVRWKHPEHGFLPPGEFIPLAEASEVIRPLTLWVLDAALAECRRWREQGLEMKVAVNLSTRNLLDDNIVVQVEAALNRHQVPARALELEITESTIMADPKRAAIALQKISALGVHLSVDDFGTGYSSLAYLKSLPVDTLKIDYSFVKDMLVEQQDEIIVSSTINLAHNLGLKVVAEGVESVEVLDALGHMGCDLAQGYYVARPMPANEVVKWLSQAEWTSVHLPESSQLKGEQG